MNAELEKLEGRAPVETTGDSIHEEKAFCMTGFKLEGTSTGEIAPHTKTETEKKGLARVLLINPTVIQRSNLLLNCSQPQKGKKKKKGNSKTAFSYYI